MMNKEEDGNFELFISFDKRLSLGLIDKLTKNILIEAPLSGSIEYLAYELYRLKQQYIDIYAELERNDQ